MGYARPLPGNFGIEVIDDATVEVDGRVMIDDLNETTDWEIPESDDYETIAGYVLHHTGKIPEAGQRLSIGDTEIEIILASNRKIESMRISHGMSTALWVRSSVSQLITNSPPDPAATRGDRW